MFFQPFLFAPSHAVRETGQHFTFCEAKAQRGRRARLESHSIHRSAGESTEVNVGALTPDSPVESLPPFSLHGDLGPGSGPASPSSLHPKPNLQFSVCVWVGAIGAGVSIHFWTPILWGGQGGPSEMWEALAPTCTLNQAAPGLRRAAHPPLGTSGGGTEGGFVSPQSSCAGVTLPGTSEWDCTWRSHL